MFYFRMLGLPKNLRERDNPPASKSIEKDDSDLEYDRDTSRKIEEAMEDSLFTDTQVSQEGKEGLAENTAKPPRTKYADVVKDPSSENTLEDTLGGNNVYSRENTLLGKHEELVENTAIPKANLRLGGTVENTTALPDAVRGRRGRRVELENTGTHSLGGIVENTTTPPDSTHKGGRIEKSRRILVSTQS